MAYYDLSKEERIALYKKMEANLASGLHNNNIDALVMYANDPDTYIRKNTYLAIGREALKSESNKQKALHQLAILFENGNELQRQTAINAFGEIGIKDFESIELYMAKGLMDKHHRVRNAVIGSIKKMGEKNPEPVLAFCKPYLQHEDFEVRREICHGIELRGRTHPQDILPMLRCLEYDKKTRVRKTLVHVLGQIAYKKGCLEIVCAHLRTWESECLVKDALEEIIDVHHRYRNFAFYDQEEAVQIIKNYFNLSV